ncbi:MAG: LuxR C-terminal-related transcriptional regulator [Solirubrobacteraceae bacterium]
MRPAALGGESVAELVRARLGSGADPRFSAACPEATGGNPLLLRQLLAALEQDRVAPSPAGELAEACGCEPLVERARSELYASGARPRTAALRGVEALTAGELRVARLAAGGRTIREIAQDLFVTPKTVEVHLSNAYRKLDIRSRRELPTAMGSDA